MAKHRFAWRGVDRKGEIQSGVLDAHTQEEVSHELKKQRIRATRIQHQFNLPNWL
jgi:type II secretory pathway component PulF